MNKKNILLVLGLASAIFVSNCSSDSSTAATDTGASTNTSGTDTSNNNNNNDNSGEKKYTQKDLTDAKNAGIEEGKKQVTTGTQSVLSYEYWQEFDKNKYTHNSEQISQAIKDAENFKKTLDATADKAKISFIDNLIIEIKRFAGCITDTNKFATAYPSISPKELATMVNQFDLAPPCSDAATEGKEWELFYNMLEAAPISDLTASTAFQLWSRLVDPAVTMDDKKFVKLGRLEVRWSGDEDFEKKADVTNLAIIGPNGEKNLKRLVRELKSFFALNSTGKGDATGNDTQVWMLTESTIDRCDAIANLNAAQKRFFNILVKIPMVDMKTGTTGTDVVYIGQGTTVKFPYDGTGLSLTVLETEKATYDSLKEIFYIAKKAPQLKGVTGAGAATKCIYPKKDDTVEDITGTTEYKEYIAEKVEELKNKTFV